MRNAVIVFFIAAFVAAAQQETLEKVCSDCHGIEQVTSRRHSAAGWQAVIDDMVTKGAVGTDKEFDTIAAYLTAHYGPLNVNKATAKELADYLQITAAQADGIVAYREKNGSIKDLATLKTLPGMDPKVLEKKKDGLSF